MCYLDRLMTYDFQKMTQAERLLILLIYEFAPPLGGHSSLIIEILSGLSQREFHIALRELELGGWLNHGTAVDCLDPEPLA
ncbi:hypothetical protein BH23GEM5_BH23GEM5_28770 [soil metagenome]|jgi:predicted transcriptional regulator